MDSQQLQVLQKYLPMGIIWGIELLLIPQVAIAFIDDLARVGIRVTGCDLWRFLDPDKDTKRIVSLPGDGITVSEAHRPQKETVEGNADLIKDYIAHQLPADADLVSLIYDNHQIYYFFRNYNPPDASSRKWKASELQSLPADVNLFL